MQPGVAKHRGKCCYPISSLDGVGLSHNSLRKYDNVELHFVDEPNGNASTDEEQGFEAVLDLSHLGNALRDDAAIAESEINVPDWQLYQKEKLARMMKDPSINSTTRRDAVFKLLETMGVKTFIVVSGREDNTEEIVQRVRDVIDFVALLKRSGLHKLGCCLLFQDNDGLLYNLVFPKEAAGPFRQFHTNMSEFSCGQALGALTILLRSLSCLQKEEQMHGQPAFLCMIIGLLLREEISLSWLNSSLLVHGIPSISSHVLISGDGFDWMHKLSIVCLTFACATHGGMQMFLYVTGINLVCTALLVNLGSRSWHFLHLRPFSFGGPMAPFFAFLAAFFAGVCCPFMGDRQIESGSKLAVEVIVHNAFWVGSLFFMSDLGQVQRLLQGETELCDQATANIAVGSWIGATMVLNLVIAVVIIKRKEKTNVAHDLILLEDHYSPVGFRVPNFPDFIIDPKQAMKGTPYVPLEYELYAAVFIALVIMGVILSLPFSDWTSTVEIFIANLISDSVQ